jgi:hypothetical protein
VLCTEMKENANEKISHLYEKLPWKTLKKSKGLWPQQKVNYRLILKCGMHMYITPANCW